MWWKLGGIGVLATILILTIAAPLASLQVSVKLPDEAGGGAATAATNGTALVVVYCVAGLFIGVVLLTAYWLARRVIRGEKRRATIRSLSN